MRLLLIASFGILFSSCFHTKKAITELSQKTDSTGFFRSDTTKVSKTDTDSTSLDLKDVVVEIDYDTSRPKLTYVDTASMLTSGLRTGKVDPEVRKISNIIQAISGGAKPIHIKFTIGSFDYDHSHIVSVDSSAEHDTSSIKVTTDSHSYVKTVDRKGTGIGGTFLMIGGIILAILIVAGILYFKFIKKIPFI